MAEEVYKILQSRLRKQAQQDTCGDQYDCEGCRQAKVDDSGKRKRPTSEDPLSHKIIEKRRRDRMNSCLADLSHLIPSNYLKKGRGRIEKTEIVEMAIKHIKHLHELLPSAGTGINEKPSSASTITSADATADTNKGSNWQCPQEVESFKNGYNECLAETVHFLVEREHIPAENPLCSRLVGHLKRYLDQRGHQPAGQGAPGSSHASSADVSASTGARPDQVKQQPEDSDYCSMRSESSAANSEVGSIVSNQSSSGNSAILNSTQRQFPLRLETGSGLTPGPATLSENLHTGSGMSLGVKRRGSEEVMSGKFKFKDSIRERFSHEFESQAENATVTSDHFTGSTEQSFPGSNHDIFGKRRRVSRSCEHFNEDAKPCTSQKQTSSKGKLPETQIDGGKEKKSVPIFALHPKGSHYIPLSVGDEVIQPYLHLFDQGSDLPLMLHPITISVNFCGPIRIAAGINRPHISHRSSHASSGAPITIPSIKEDRAE